MLKEQNTEMEVLLKKLPVLNEYFQLHSKIGQGTFSTVYLATLRNSSSTKKYAVKHLKQAREHSKIQNELSCLQDIGGKDNVVPAELCLTNGDDCVTFIMPYLAHLCFSDYVVDMDAEETRLYMKNLFIALRRVHSFNIIHRDVKPNNFLYNRETKEFLLVDFGLAEYVRTPRKPTNPSDENLPLDYSKKRKRTPEPEETGEAKVERKEEEHKTPVKGVKRMALKLKDSNVKLSPSKAAVCDHRDREKTATSLRDEEIKSPELKEEKATTSASSSNFKSTMDEGEKSLEELKNKPEVKFMENSARLSRGKSFTPLVPSKSPNGTFLQVKDSRVVRQQRTATTTRPSTSGPACPCSGKAAICSICSSRKIMYAPRAGTSGFRPPEVLFRYPYQTTAVDMWASGVVMLCILSGCYPFFDSSSDLVSLAEIMTVFGTERTIKVAKKFGRRIICSEQKKGVDLKKLCTRLRNRPKKKSKKERSSSNEPKCRDCLQTIREDGCLCPSDEEISSPESKSDCLFPDSAFDLLKRLLDLDPTTRITAAEALEHPFITGQ